VYRKKQVIPHLTTKISMTHKPIRYMCLMMVFAVIIMSRMDAVSAPGSATPVEYQKMANYIKDFEKSKNVCDLGKGMEIVEEIWTGDTVKTDWKSSRALKTRLWLYLLNYIEKQMDPTFDPKDEPEMNISVAELGESTMTNEILFAGMDPQGIKDPKLRKKYEEALKKRDDKHIRQSFQWNLLQLREELAERLKQHIKRSFKTPEDVLEMDELMKLEITDKAKIDRLKKELLPSR